MKFDKTKLGGYAHRIVTESLHKTLPSGKGWWGIGSMVPRITFARTVPKLRLFHSNLFV